MFCFPYLQLLHYSMNVLIKVKPHKNKNMNLKKKQIVIFWMENCFFQNYTRAFLRYVIYICLLKRGYFNVKQNNKPSLNNKFRLALIPSYKNRNTFSRKIMNCFSLSLSNLQLRRLNTAIYQTNLYVFSINNNTRSL